MADWFSAWGAMAPNDGVGEADFALLTGVGRVVPDDGYDSLRQRSRRARVVDPRLDNGASPRATLAWELNVHTRADRESVRSVRELHVL